MVKFQTVIFLKVYNDKNLKFSRVTQIWEIKQWVMDFIKFGDIMVYVICWTDMEWPLCQSNLVLESNVQLNFNQNK